MNWNQLILVQLSYFTNKVILQKEFISFTQEKSNFGSIPTISWKMKNY